jgi:DNA-binding SARP family transcriptional activator
LRVLGGFEAHRGGDQTVVFSAKKPAALLCYLAFHAGVAQPRDVLSTLLWEDRAQEQARGSLRQALTALRKILPDGALHAGADHVTLVPAAVAVDALALRADVAAGVLDSAARPIAAICSPASMSTRRHSRSGCAANASSAPGGARRARGIARSPARRRRAGGGAAHRRALALDPREDVHRALMELYALSGSAPRRCASTVSAATCSAELGAQPEPATEALHAAIRAGEGARPCARGRRRRPSRRRSSCAGHGVERGAGGRRWRRQPRARSPRSAAPSSGP